MEVEILLLSEANSKVLTNIGPDVFDHPIDATQLQAFLKDPRHMMYVAVKAGMVVGMVSAVEYFHPDKQPQLWINEVGVASTCRRAGIGRMLVEAIIDAAKKRNCVFAWLGTDVDNKPAQACFDSIPEFEDPQAFLMYEWDAEG